MIPKLEDSFGRTLDYLRISVTDRCNFRCLYCMPPEGIPLLPHQDILTFEEITRLVRIFLRLGGSRVRITGGEPLLRKGIVRLVARLAGLPGLRDLSLTTNGFYLSEWVEPLKEAGLQRVNVSLDSLDPRRFSEMTGVPRLEAVWRGVERALALGLKTKINVVVLRGMSEEEMVRFGDLAKEFPLEVRFIEFMPLCGTGWHPEWVFPIDKVKSILQRSFTLVPMVRGREVAESYRIEGGEGSVGFIASLSDPFCAQCSRLRLTADGKLRLCLFSNIEVDLKPWLRSGLYDDDQIAQLWIDSVKRKPRGHGIDYPIAVKRPEEFPRIRFVGG